MPQRRDPRDIAGWLRERVTGALQCDSRKLRAGDGFVAWPGAATDGRRYVAAALQAGASAVLVEAEGVESFGFSDDRIRAVPGLKALAGPIASAYHGDPSAALDMVAITGTNGKTSSAWWAAQLLSGLGRPCALIGTLGIGRAPTAGTDGMHLVSTGLTTPDPVLLQSRLRDMVDEGVVACAIEASSIGLVEGRLNACHIRVAVFTNFSQDHLDFHGSMTDYWEAKAALFHWPGLESAVVNVDDPQGMALDQALAGRPQLGRWSVGIDRPARLMARDIAFTDHGMRFEVVEHDARGAVCDRGVLTLGLIGRYNVSNLLGVIGVARALGVALSDALAACSALTPVPGRMEQAAAAAGQPLVLVDYAHTPDALEKALRALQPLAQQRGGQLWVLAGCGGDRDPGKRPLMGSVVEREAQRVVLTSDNPRSEDPMAILEQMRAGLQRPERVGVQVERARAIADAVAQAAPADVILIAGKGHEDYQEVKGVRHPFSDLAHARAALARRGASA
ncbi:MAG: UDP-N-acetylmuramoyl-L-alanyl-D-glutamate--2,6-diaminopimelate ligase [Hydrogenophaga sp.]|nr:UDP-N-acetylmuramoyl-L-alanyl-D-glutamate--2,6-diaminopimelate ligase [Hydrogenophaga sp.]